MYKKKFGLIVLLLLLTLVFTSCNLKDLGKPESEKGTKEVIIIVSDIEYKVNTDVEYLHELLLEMKNNEVLDYEFEDTAYGPSPIKIGNLESKTEDRTYLALYHDIDDVTLRGDIGEYAMPGVNFKEKYYYYSSVGFAIMPVYNGHMYYITLSSY